MFRRQPIVQRQYRALRADGQLPTDRIVRVQAADAITAAMQIDQHWQRHTGLLRPIQPCRQVTMAHLRRDLLHSTGRSEWWQAARSGLELGTRLCHRQLMGSRPPCPPALVDHIEIGGDFRVQLARYIRKGNTHSANVSCAVCAQQ